MSNPKNYLEIKNVKAEYVVAQGKAQHYKSESGAPIVRLYMGLSVPGMPAISKVFVELSVTDAYLTKKKGAQSGKEETKLNVTLQPSDIEGCKQLDLGCRLALTEHAHELGEFDYNPQTTKVRGCWFMPRDPTTKQLIKDGKPMMSMKLHKEHTIFRVVNGFDLKKNADGTETKVAKFKVVKNTDVFLKKKLKCVIVFHLRDICKVSSEPSAQVLVSTCVVFAMENANNAEHTVANSSALSEYLRLNPNMIDLATQLGDLAEGDDAPDAEGEATNKLAGTALGRSSPPPALNFAPQMGANSGGSLAQANARTTQFNKDLAQSAPKAPELSQSAQIDLIAQQQKLAQQQAQQAIAQQTAQAAQAAQQQAWQQAQAAQAVQAPAVPTPSQYPQMSNIPIVPAVPSTPQFNPQSIDQQQAQQQAYMQQQQYAQQQAYMQQQGQYAQQPQPGQQYGQNFGVPQGGQYGQQGQAAAPDINSFLPAPGQMNVHRI